MKRNIILFLFFIAIIGCIREKQSENYGKYTRDELRYYAYAPPLIPHEVLNKQCLDCHGDGLVVQGYKAPVTPHPELLNCQQCHIRADESTREFRQNLFVGFKEPQKLPLPQPSGPPLMPHRVFMRENCLVCHGDASRDDIVQTTHPERLNCVQCHVEQESGVAAFIKNTPATDF